MRSYGRIIGCLFAGLALAHAPAAAQGALSVRTDRPAYAYGEAIELHVTISNPTEETFRLGGSSTCQAQFRFDGFDSRAHTVCTLDEVEIAFPPGSERTWSWVIRPEVLGLPDTGDRHTVVGYYPGTELADTTTVEAPRFLGGRLGVGLARNASADEIAPVKDSLDVQVLSSFETEQGLSEIWQISGVAVDSAVAHYREDARFRYIEVLRSIQYDRVVGVEERPEIRASAALTPAYPNPFVDASTFMLEPPRTEHVRVVVYDLLGRMVDVLHDGVLSGGSRHRFSFEAGSLPSGLYVYGVDGASFSASGTVLLAR